MPRIAAVGIGVGLLLLGLSLWRFSDQTEVAVDKFNALISNRDPIETNRNSCV
jgi:hypothetical protein